MGTINRPVAFTGTEEERRANRASHHFITYQYGEDDFEAECATCFCKPGGMVSNWPCGTEPPREVVTYG